MDLDDIIEEITAGGLDGSLEAIVSAVVDRVRAGAVEMRWRVNFDGDEFTQDTVTLGELKFAEQHCYVEVSNGRGQLVRRRASRAEIDPRVYAEHTLALIIAHLYKAQGVSLADATKRAEAITAGELEDLVGEYEVVRPPKDGSAASTSS